MEFLLEFLSFLKHRRKFWLWPLFMLIGLLSLITFLAQGTALGPFIYSLF